MWNEFENKFSRFVTLIEIMVEIETLEEFKGKPCPFVAGVKRLAKAVCFICRVKVC